jgi:hypothetical protein
MIPSSSSDPSSTWSPSETNLAAALRLSRGGLAVFPCQDTPSNKATDNASCFGIKWREQSTTNPATIRAWWSRWPGAIPAIDLGKSGLLVIDPDRHVDGPDGVAYPCNNWRQTPP